MGSLSANEVPTESLQAFLTSLEVSLDSSIRLLRSPKTQSQLKAALHDDKRLPDKELAETAGRVVDLLASIEHMLEPADLVLADHFLGYTNTKCLVAAVELKIPDHLADGTVTVEKLAELCKAKPNRLRQILRPLHNCNIFSYDETTDTYANNHVSRLLQSDHWTQWHNWVDLYGNEFYEIARGIPTAVREGTTRSAAQVNFATDQDMFTYFQRRGWVPRLHRTLGGGQTAMAPGILADFPWQELAGRTVLDIGGGGGALIASLLRANPTMRGGIFDLPKVIDHVAPFFTPEGQFADVAARVPRENLIVGDFLQEIPSFEMYVMKWVLHDWLDQDALKILQNVRKAIVPGLDHRLVVMESILAEGRSGRLSRYGDINMMMTANGQERTEEQWRALAQQSGWKVQAIFPLRNAWVQAIDLRPE